MISVETPIASQAVTAQTQTAPTPRSLEDKDTNQPFRFTVPSPNPPRCPCETYLDGDIDPSCPKHGGKQ